MHAGLAANAQDTFASCGQRPVVVVDGFDFHTRRQETDGRGPALERLHRGRREAPGFGCAVGRDDVGAHMAPRRAVEARGEQAAANLDAPERRERSVTFRQGFDDHLQRAGGGDHVVHAVPRDALDDGLRCCGQHDQAAGPEHPQCFAEAVASSRPEHADVARRVGQRCELALDENALMQHLVTECDVLRGSGGTRRTDDDAGRRPARMAGNGRHDDVGRWRLQPARIDGKHPSVIRHGRARVGDLHVDERVRHSGRAAGNARARQCERDQQQGILIGNEQRCDVPGFESTFQETRRQRVDCSIEVAIGDSVAGGTDDGRRVRPEIGVAPKRFGDVHVVEGSDVRSPRCHPRADRARGAADDRKTMRSVV